MVLTTHRREFLSHRTMTQLIVLAMLVLARLATAQEIPFAHNLPPGERPLEVSVLFHLDHVHEINEENETVEVTIAQTGSTVTMDVGDGEDDFEGVLVADECVMTREYWDGDLYTTEYVRLVFTSGTACTGIVRWWMTDEDIFVRGGSTVEASR